MRQAIIERVAKSCEMESAKGQIGNILDDAGFFELLDVAVRVIQKAVSMDPCEAAGEMSIELLGLNIAINNARGDQPWDQ